MDNLNTVKKEDLYEMYKATCDAVKNFLEKT